MGEWPLARQASSSSGTGGQCPSRAHHPSRAGRSELTHSERSSACRVEVARRPRFGNPNNGRSLGYQTAAGDSKPSSVISHLNHAVKLRECQLPVVGPRGHALSSCRSELEWFAVRPARRRPAAASPAEHSQSRAAAGPLLKAPQAPHARSWARARAALGDDQKQSLLGRPAYWLTGADQEQAWLAVHAAEVHLTLARPEDALRAELPALGHRRAISFTRRRHQRKSLPGYR